MKNDDGCGVIRKVSLSAVLAMALMSGGCSVTGGEDGFPDPDDAYMREGTLESSQAIKTLQPGMTKDQVRDLLGNPHFSEGLFNVRTWNYLFDLGADGEHEPMMCQFQLAFDEKMRVAETRWRTARCAIRFSSIQVEPIEGSSMVHYYRLPIEGMFSTDGSLTDKGQHLLGDFVDILQHELHDPVLSIGSYPEPGQYRAQRQAVQRFLETRGGNTIEDVSLTSAAVSLCQGQDSAKSCRSTQQIVIEIREP
ncbi:outer membrane protein assembly factor BamE [Halomonas eurihalina]|uniref:Outer membrane protein assembly factor BamE n=1 Tax=Halomonas eurihalina TaxID=42566 RepID=A0A5D9D8F6_HALER|nr:outer membrane protein assembly factor BamE [Halomonas eurihalina]MDR5860681.1 outer membrane protein assembly factor BamE [Halomonas eurihalina]TZG40096.1 outer membrane protein assembly factor BamE [Halomonas eurihalina]